MSLALVQLILTFADLVIFSGMIFHIYPSWSAVICNHYWHLRAARSFNSARKRKEYRRIAVEKNAWCYQALILKWFGCYAGIWLIRDSNLLNSDSGSDILKL